MPCWKASVEAASPRGLGSLLKLHDGDTGQSTTEALICLDCARIDDAHSKIVEKEIRDTLKHVAAAVKDFGQCASSCV